MDNTEDQQPQPELEQAQPKSWRQNKNVFKLIVVAVIAGVVILLYFILAQPRNLNPVVIDYHTKNEPIVAPSSTPLSQTQTPPNYSAPSSDASSSTPAEIWAENQGWFKYDTYGSINGIDYSVYYPPDWGQQNIGFFVDKANSALSFNAPSPGLSSYGFGSSTAITIDEETATETFITGRTDAEYIVVTFNNPDLNGNFDIAMNFQWKDSDRYTKLLNQILSTFKFNYIDTDISGWQNISNPNMNTHLRVPTGWSVAQLTADKTFISNAAQAQNMTIPGANDSFIIVSKNPKCNSTNAFKVGDYGPKTLIEIKCLSGYQFVLGVWSQSYDKTNIIQALEKIPSTFTYIQ